MLLAQCPVLLLHRVPDQIVACSVRALRDAELARWSVRDIAFAGPVPDDLHLQESAVVDWTESPCPESDPTLGVYDASGEWITPEQLKLGHAEEIRWLQKEGVWELVDTAQ